MFLLPSIVLGIAFALLLGGRPSRMLDVDFRHGWTVVLSLCVQLMLFTDLGAAVPSVLEVPLHLASYALLLGFAAANIRNLALLPLLAGMGLNALAIAANGGHMPVSPGAWDAAGLGSTIEGNVRLGADRLAFLGDVFALPRSLPLANVFSVGDLLIALGTIGFIVMVSTGDPSERPLSPARLVRPLGLSSFRRLAIGKLVSHLGDWLTLAALIGWVYEKTGSTGQVAALMLIRLVPPILGGGLAAAVVDKFPRERLLVLAELVRGGVVAGALAAVVADSRPLAFGAIAVSGVLAPVSAAAMSALVPSLLRRDELPAANAGLSIAQDSAMALGALGAGIALSASTAALALALDLGTFVVAAALFWGIQAPLVQLDHGATGSTLRAGVRYLLGRRSLLVVVLSFAAATLATGLTNATLPRLLGDELSLGAGAYGFGLAALAGGLVAGEALVGLAHVGPGSGRWIGCALLLMSGLFVVLGLTEHAPTALLLLGLIGFVDGTTDVLFETIVQRETHPRYLGRVFGFSTAFMRTTMVGAVAAAPLLNRVAPPHEIVFVAGGWLVAVGCVALAGSGRAAPASVLPARVGSR